MLIVCILGLFGNISAIIAFSKPHRAQKNFFVFMLYLAIFDILYIIVAILLFVLPLLSTYYKNEGPWHYVVPWAIPVGQISMTGCVYFTTVITIERYLIVCHPFYTFARNWSSALIGIGITSFAVLYNIPKFFETYTIQELCYLNTTYNGYIKKMTYSSESCMQEFQNRGKMESSFFDNVSTNMKAYNPVLDEEYVNLSRYSVLPTDMRLSSAYVQAYAVYLNFVINGVVPFVLVITLNISIIRELQKIDRVSSPFETFPGNNNPLKSKYNLEYARIKCLRS